MIKHIVMWTVSGETRTERDMNRNAVRSEFEGLKGKIPGLLYLEIGIDESDVSYACDVVLYTEFSDHESLEAYATHPEHILVKERLDGLRKQRHQVDYTAVQCR